MVETRARTGGVVDVATFRQAMSQLASGVNIITVWDDARVAHGMTATAFCSVSADPPQVLVCVNRHSRTHALVEHAGLFGVSVLAANAEAISAHCARPGGDKRLEASCLATGTASCTPAVEGALVHLDCEVAGQYRAGTHSIFVGRVGDVDLGEDEDPLVYFRGAYHDLTRRDAAN